MKRNIKSIIAACLVLVLFNMVACKKLSSFDYPDGTATTYTVIKEDLNYSIFRYAVDRAGLAELLNGKEEYTVFIPTNGAFTNSGYPQTVLATMTIPDLAALIKNHIFAGRIDAQTIGASETKANLSGQSVLLQRIGSNAYIDGADVTNANQATSNGMVHVINKIVVTKPTMLDVINAYSNTTANSQFTISIAAIARASTGNTNFTNILTGTAPYTFFLPNNGAWIDGGYASVAAVTAATPAALETILKNHLVTDAKFTSQLDSTTTLTPMSGIKIYIDKGKPSRTTNIYANGILFGNGIASNMKAVNGVVHTVSRLLPTPIATNTLDRIKSDATLTLFAAMLKRASAADPAVNYETLLSDPLKFYTVFAVNNAGIIAAGYADANAINAEKAEVIANIVKFHMIYRRANNINYPENGLAVTLLRTKNSAGTEVGNSLTFSSPATFLVKGPSNPATISVITKNVVTTNGLLNIIGTVLKP
ncbi:MAG: fasciclin domain-containing protein [Pedobacter sp.]|nr:fasciclin domain-containing protein [Pedobacter sp.]MDQ8052179.1 fasciclin domain-containing protein [Pedobacter sp.]